MLKNEIVYFFERPFQTAVCYNTVKAELLDVFGLMKYTNTNTKPKIGQA